MNHLIVDRIPQHHYQIETSDISFVVCENPTQQNLAEFCQLFEASNVKHLIRTSIQNYATDMFSARKIQIYEMQFSHSAVPTDEIITKVIKIVESAISNNQNVAIQGVSGRTRAPLLVACVLCERGKSVNDAIQIIRSSINGQVFNPDQIEFLYAKYGKKL